MLSAGHIWDFYTYTAIIKQGQDGHIFFRNLFAFDDPAQFIFAYWPYSLAGFISSPFHIPAHVVNIGLALISALFVIILEYLAIKLLLAKETAAVRLSAFILLLTAAPFYHIFENNTLTIVPFDYWYSIGNPLYRYGLPNHTIAHGLLLACLLFASRIPRSKRFVKNVGTLFLLSGSLFMTYATLLPVFWTAYIAASVSFAILRYRIAPSPSKPNEYLREFFFKYMGPLLLASLLLAPFIFFFYKTVATSPTYQSNQAFDLWNFYYPGLVLFIKVTGPIILLAIGGAYFYLRDFTFARLLFFFTTLISLVITLVPISIGGKNILAYGFTNNLRFHNSVVYIAMAVSAAICLQHLAKKSVVLGVLTAIFVVFALPIPINTLVKTVTGPDAREIPFHNMPQSLFDGLSVLDTYNDDKVVLTTPDSGYGLLVPMFSGKRVYIGRVLLTLDFEHKLMYAQKIFNLETDPAKFLTFMKETNIGYIIFPKSNYDSSVFIRRYPFLNILFQNEAITIFGI